MRTFSFFNFVNRSIIMSTRKTFVKFRNIAPLSDPAQGRKIPPRSQYKTIFHGRSEKEYVQIYKSKTKV